MNMFGKLGDLKKLRDQAVAIQKQLQQEVVTIEEGDIRVVISGDQQIREFTVSGITSEDAVKVLNKAIKESQKVAAKKLQEMGGGLSGMLGGGN